MKKEFDFKIILPAAIVIAVAIYLALINITIIYQSQTDILIIPKNLVAAGNSSQILGNAVEIAHSVSFYDKMVSSDGNINNPVKALPGIKRENYWDLKIKTERIGDSGIVRTIVSDADRAQAEMISRGATRSLIDIMSGYYNIKTDLDLRVIDGPITGTATSENIIWIVLESILGGLIIAALTERLSLFFVKNIEFGSGANKSACLTKKFEKFWKFSETEKPAPEIKNELPLKFDEKFVTSGKKQAAPGNLPIADESAFFQIQEKNYANGKTEEKPEKDEKKTKAENEMAQSGPKQDIFREATPEEVKERLNKLLSGKF